MSLLGVRINFPLEASWSVLNLNPGTATYKLGVLDKVGGQAVPWNLGSEMKLDSKALCKVALESLGTLERWELGSFRICIYLCSSSLCALCCGLNV